MKLTSSKIFIIVFMIMGIGILSWIGTESYDRYQGSQLQKLEQLRDNM